MSGITNSLLDITAIPEIWGNFFIHLYPKDMGALAMTSQRALAQVAQLSRNRVLVLEIFKNRLFQVLENRTLDNYCLHNKSNAFIRTYILTAYQKEPYYLVKKPLGICEMERYESSQLNSQLMLDSHQFHFEF